MTLLLTALTIAALALIGLWLHHLFEGEWLPRDLWREWRLSRISLAQLDQTWSETPNRSDIVISLTTTPSRIGLIEPTLKSLLNQTRAPARIILNVPDFSKREGVAYTIPSDLTNLNALEIHRTKDLGPATKLIPTLTAVDPDTPILIVDDDRIYPRWLLETYEGEAAKTPDLALTMAGWIVPGDLTDRDTTIRSNLAMQPPAPIRAHRLAKPREVDVFLGVFSYLVRPRFFDMDEMQDLDAGPPELFYVDDVRSSALCKVGIWVIPAASLSFIPWQHRKALQKTRLGHINAGPSDNESRHNTIAIRHYRDRWRIGGPK